MTMANAAIERDDRVKEKRKEMLEILMMIPRSSTKQKQELRRQLETISAEIKRLEGKGCQDT